MNAPERDTPLAELSGVGKVYGREEAAVAALRDVDLALWPGDLVVVLGPSGSGKTTLLNVLGGIEPATTGRVVLAGHDLSGLGPEALADVRRDTVGFVFQFFNLIPTLTARENVAVVAELTDGRSATRGQRVGQALAGVGLAAKADRFPGHLSGGEQQRVAVARALVTRPRLLLCDEPTGSLDLDTGREVLTLLRAATDEGRAVVLVTHNQAIAAMADRVLRMRAGRVVDDIRQERPVPAADVTW
jgi:putative ABC transport system ATP-binding protein